MTQESQRSIEDVLDDHVHELTGVPHVVGAGIGEVDGRRVIKAFTDCPPGEVSGLPADLEGFEVVAEQRGQVSALGGSQGGSPAGMDSWPFAPHARAAF